MTAQRSNRGALLTDVRRPARPRVLLVFGTRPEAIKLAPVAIALRQHEDEFQTFLCSTGQHRDMLDQALASFDLAPDVDLGLMRPGQTLTGLATRALRGLDRVFGHVRPDVVIVQGDTTSALTGALAAYHRKVAVAHLEAGLRTDDLYQPFPEEGNRRLISAIATLHFAPSAGAGRRLRRESVPADRILVTGNTVIDALLLIRRQIRGTRQPEAWAPVTARGHGAAAGGPGPGRLILLTMHRRESAGHPREDVCRAVLSLVERNPDVTVAFPVHASPAVREPVERLLGQQPRIRLSEPLDYRQLVGLLDVCYLVLTDSGGLQEEAPALGKPVLVLRDKTERPEAIRAGTSRLVGTNTRRVLRAAETLLHDSASYDAMAHAENPYGDGRAAERVLGALRFHFGLAKERPAALAQPSRKSSPFRREFAPVA